LSAKERQELSLPEPLREETIPTLPNHEQTQAIHARTHWLSEKEREQRRKVDKDEGFYLDV
jgi:hypothetical protein